MTTATRQGSPQFPTFAGSMQPSTREEMDAALQVLQEHKNTWVAVSTRSRTVLVEALIQDFAALAGRWVAACCEAKGISNTPFVGEEWATGPFVLLKQLRQLHQSLLDIEALGAPTIPGPVTTRADGQVVAQVFPLTSYYYSPIFDVRWLPKRIDIAYPFLGDLAWGAASPALILHNRDCSTKTLWRGAGQ